MRIFGKLMGQDSVEDGQLAWVMNELDKYCVKFSVEDQGDGFLLVWFEPNQVPKLPYHLGVYDKLLASYNETLPMYSQVYFHRVDERLLGE